MFDTILNIKIMSLLKRKYCNFHLQKRFMNTIYS